MGVQCPAVQSRASAGRGLKLIPPHAGRSTNMPASKRARTTKERGQRPSKRSPRRVMFLQRQRERRGATRTQCFSWRSSFSDTKGATPAWRSPKTDFLCSLFAGAGVILGGSKPACGGGVWLSEARSMLGAPMRRCWSLLCFCSCAVLQSSPGRSTAYDIFSGDLIPASAGFID